MYVVNFPTEGSVTNDAMLKSLEETVRKYPIQ
jgi:hypothetical protein